MQPKIDTMVAWLERRTNTNLSYVIGGGFWLILARITDLILTFVLILAFARFIPKDIYGTYSYVISIATLLGIFTLSGLNSPLVRSITRCKEGMLLETARLRITWSLIGSAASLGIAAWYYSKENTDLAFSFFLVALFLPLFNTLSQLILRFWQGRQQFRTHAIYRISFLFLTRASFIPVLFFTNNLLYIILTFFLSHAIFAIILFVLTLRKTQNKEKEKGGTIFGKHLTLMQAAEVVGNNIDKVILWHFLGAIPVAIYSFAQLPISRIQDLFPIQALALPKLSETDNVNKKGLLTKVAKLYILVIPVVIILFLIATPLYSLVFPAYTDAIPYFQGLSLTLLFLPFFLLSSVFIAHMHKRQLYIITFTNIAFRISLFLALVPLYGIWGIIIAMILSRILHAMLLLFFFVRLKEKTSNP